MIEFLNKFWVWILGIVLLFGVSGCAVSGDLDKIGSCSFTVSPDSDTLKFLGVVFQDDEANLD